MSAAEDLMPRPDAEKRLRDMTRRSTEARAKVRQHCGDFTTDIVCPVCGCWLVKVLSD